MTPFISFTLTPDYWRVMPEAPLVPGVRYAGSANRYKRVTDLQAAHGVRLVHDAAPADGLTQWRGEDLNGKRLAFYSDVRLGDALTHTAVVRELGLRYPGAETAVLSDASTMAIWDANHHCRNSSRPALPFFPADALGTFDYWIAPGWVGYEHRSSERNIYDLLAEAMGLDAIATPVPHVTITAKARGEIREGVGHACWNVRGALPPDIWRRLVLVQINSRERARTPDGRYHLLRTICETVGESHYVAVYGDGDAMNEVLQGAQAYGPLLAGPRPEVGREVWPHDRAPVFIFATHHDTPGPTVHALLVMHEAAKLVICPDSFGLHAAAAFDTPTIALWNLTPGAAGDDGAPIPPPVSRLGTYGNAVAIDMKPGGPRDRALAALVKEALRL